MSQVGSERPASPAAPSQATAAVSVAPAEATAPSKPKNDAFYPFWDRFYSPPPPPKKSVTPSLDVDVEDQPGHPTRRNTLGLISSESATVSFDEAAATCRRKVGAIVAECRRLNIKYSDPLFQIGQYDTLASLAPGNNPESVTDDNQFKGSVKRIAEIFDEPEFMIDGATVNDVRQGCNGNCWFLAAVTALSGTEEPGEPLRLIDKLCVARDPQAGVYGFVFHRDGEWISEVIDDKLCITESAESLETMPKKLKPLYAKGSDALYFASCRDSNETWLPLLEKAYAKAHGDYQCIEGGVSGEGIEDLTGGVSTSLRTEDILDKNVLWSELQRVNRDFLFGCSSRRGMDTAPADQEGFVRGHAYTVLEAREIDGHRLLKIRNPWGKQEWKGAWSDGSKEWNPERLRAANHRFGDDGIFWISFADFPTYYPRMDRTRLFGPEWTVTQQWTSIEVPYSIEYHETKFSVDVMAKGPLVIVLAMPDERYFAGLDGRFAYDLHFRLYREGNDTYLLRSMTQSGLGRSCAAEFDATPGRYHILMKITAVRYDDVRTAEEAMKCHRRKRRDKLLAIGKSFDSIHSKGLLREAENARAERLKRQEKQQAKSRKVEMLKREREWDRENRRKERLRGARVEAEIARKKEVKRAEKASKATTNLASERNGGAAEAHGRGAGNQGDDGTSKGREKQKDSEEEGEEEEEEEEEEDDEEEEEEEEDSDSDSKDPINSLASNTSRLTVSNPATNTTVKVNKPGPTAASTDNITTTPDGSDPSADEDKAGAADGAPKDDDNVSEISAIHDEDFEWDSDIDSPPDLIEVPADPDPEEDMFAKDPWNAICVVGLRVYSTGAGVKVGVVREGQAEVDDKESGRGKYAKREKDGGDCGPGARKDKRLRSRATG